MGWLVSLVVMLGMAFLAMSLPSIASILRTLGRGRLRTNWMWLCGLIVAFLTGYAVFGLLRIGVPVTIADLVVSVILAAGGAFVLMVARLSDLTTKDIVRITALERDVVRDPLTGLFNRRYLDMKLDEEVNRSYRSGSPLSALIIDIDHFKHVNDTYGHLIGDQIIRNVSNLLADRARSGHTVARYGGEEFVILAPDCDLAEIAVLGERLREEIVANIVRLQDGSQLTLTASLGVATLATDETPVQLLQRADNALYNAKHTGRNRLCVSESSRESLAS